MSKTSKLKKISDYQFQKKIVRDDGIGAFLSKISELEKLIFDKIEHCIEEEEEVNLCPSVSTLVKMCNSLLDLKKKQLEIKRVTNFSEYED
jgi:hypothetical protein